MRQQLSYEDTAKKVRNKLRSYSAVSVVHHALELTQSTHKEILLDELKELPWITFLLVKVVLEDQMIPLYDGKSCPKDLFDSCRRELWNAANIPPDDANGNIYLMVRSLIPAQLSFQKKPTLDFLRWPALIARLNSTHPVRLQFEQRIGITPDEFMCLCYSVYVPVISGNMIFNKDYFSPLMSVYANAIECFMSEFARNLHELRSELRKNLVDRVAENIAVRPRYEAFEFPWLSKYPLLRGNQHNYVVWHPLIFARGMEQAVHKRLSEDRENYANHFSKVFEDYVIELIKEAELKYLSEQEYKKAVGNNKNAVEAIITNDEANVFIESKMTAYSEKLSLSDLKPIVWPQLKRVREAMKQGWMVSSRLCEGGLPDWDCINSKENFLIIVTSQQTSCATGEHFRRMFDKDIFDPSRPNSPTIKQLEMLPLINIVIVSIEEFEHLMGCVIKKEIDLVSFLREVAAAHSDPKTSVMFIDQMLSSKTKKFKLPQLLETANRRVEGLLRKVLPS
ncbi:MAG: hypothetical protein E6Q59_04630 [Nitrosomonas sp.]|nr:hypothetical protein [Nitrosomonas sp.]OQW81397.1 MAG: hypothetical protein BVN30_11340 [Proteobacteria bacterium ST_bin16]TXI39666.1 MAG: hypothetical protein E6Q59_04630 [Nitrosomonas sp.]